MRDSCLRMKNVYIGILIERFIHVHYHYQYVLIYQYLAFNVSRQFMCLKI